MTVAHVDPALCQGHGQCAARSSFFVLDDDGYVEFEQATIPPDLVAEAREGAGMCPERAISIIEE